MGRTVSIDLLGGFEVRVDDRVVSEADWDRRRPMELVQMLALAPGHRMVRDQVIDTLWPHLDLDAGAANLRKTAHRARGVLGPESVVLKAGHVALFPDDTVTTDVERFHAAASDALRSKDPGRCDAVAATARGELLPGSPYEEWSTGPRRSAQQTLLSLLRSARNWERVLDLDPTDERAYQQLMRTALEDGARAEAIRWFGEARTVLAAEMGVRPSPETEALHEIAVAGPAAPPVLVGRDVEVATARSALRSARDPRIGALTVRGAPGIGKSALCRQIARGLAEDGWAVRWADSTRIDTAYGPLVSMVEEILLGAPEVSRAVGEHVRSVLAALSSVVQDAPLAVGPLSRHQVIGAVTHVVRAAAAGRDTLVVLDDAHNADNATVDLLVHLATSVPDIAVLLAHRPEPTSAELLHGLDRIDRIGRLVRIDLEPLDAAQVAELAQQVAAKDIDEGELRRVVELSGGNPFAVTELARSEEPLDAHLPHAVAEALTARLVEHDADTVALLQRLALGSDGLDSSTVVALTGTSETEAFRLLDRALEAGVLLVEGSRYRFRHDLIREALVALVPPHQRLAVHRDAARRLASSGAEPAAVARQWLLASQPAEAADWCVRAARAAMQVGAFRDARRHVAPVLRHDPTHHDALLLDAECLDMMGDPSALAAYDAAIEVADETERDDLVVNRALAQVKQGDPEGGLRAIEGATPRTALGRINEALTYAGAAVLGATDPSIGTAKAAECRRLALETGDRAGVVIAAWAHAAAAHARGDLHDSVLADLRETKDLPHLAVRVFDGQLCMTQRFLYGSRPYSEVIEFADALTEEAERIGAARGRAFGVTLRGEALLLSGRLDDATVELTRAVGLHRDTAGTTGQAHAVQRLADLAHRAGRRADAHALIDEALDLARTTDVGFHLLDRMYGSRIALAEDPEQGLALVEEAEAAVSGPLETCPGCRIHLTVPAAIAAARGGDLEGAAEYERAADYLANVVMRLPAWYAALAEVRGHVALARGDEESARASFHLAAEGFASAGQPLDEQRCRSLC